MLGEFSPVFAPHVATNAAIAHACALHGLKIDPAWVSTEAADDSLFDEFDGVWIAPGSPYKNFAKTLAAIRRARENGVPCFGTCGGFQHMIVEYARNVLGFADAQHAEYDPTASRLFVSKLACSLAGREMDLRLVPDSAVAKIYGATCVREKYYCNFGVNPDCVDVLKSGPLKISGSDAEGEVRVIELPGHPFFVGTLFVPQARSTPENSHPLVTAFLASVTEACEKRRAGI